MGDRRKAIEYDHIVAIYLEEDWSRELCKLKRVESLESKPFRSNNFSSSTQEESMFQLLLFLFSSFLVFILFYFCF